MLFSVIFYFLNSSITICYEGQLAGKHLRPEYRVQNLDNQNELLLKCQGGNSEIRDVRGLNIATYKFETKRVKIVYPEDAKLKNSSWTHMFKISTNFINKE